MQKIRTTATSSIPFPYYVNIMLCSSHPVIFRVILLLTGVFQACNAAEAESKQQKCMNKTTFVEICTTHLIADPNSDQLSSQREFVSFLDNLAANYSQTNATGPSSFDTSSISFQIPYMYHLCSYMKKQMNTTSNNDCQDILLNSNITSAYNLNISRDNFGFLLTDVQNNDDEKEISSLCSDLFIPSIEAGYINPCAVSIPPVDTVSSGQKITIN